MCHHESGCGHRRKSLERRQTTCFSRRSRTRAGHDHRMLFPELGDAVSAATTICPLAATSGCLPAASKVANHRSGRWQEVRGTAPIGWPGGFTVAWLRTRQSGHRVANYRRSRTGVPKWPRRLPWVWLPGAGKSDTASERPSVEERRSTDASAGLVCGGRFEGRGHRDAARDLQRFPCTCQVTKLRTFWRFLSEDLPASRGIL
jgi:hypothetical protein